MHSIAWQASGRAYQQRDYNFMTDNCHTFVAHVMNEIAYGGSRKWDMVTLVRIPEPVARDANHR
jgi:hypothetical protein